MSLEKIVHEPTSEAKATVIWLHGLGADGHDFEPVIPQLDLPETSAIRFIFPHAPMIPVTLNAGFVMRAWYDIKSLESNRDEDADGIRQSATAVAEIISAETEKGIDSEKIFLAGFSQGGAIALHLGLRLERKIAGVIALSTYLPLHESLATEAHEANKSTPIFMAHGQMDPIVPINAGTMSRDYLEKHGYEISWHQYPMEHSVCMEEIKSIGRWIQDTI